MKEVQVFDGIVPLGEFKAQAAKLLKRRRVRERLTEIEAFVACDHPEAEVRLVDKLIARGDAWGRYPDRGRKLPEIPGSGLRELVLESYRIVYRRMLNAIEVLTVREGHRLLRRDEFP